MGCSGGGGGGGSCGHGDGGVATIAVVGVW